MRTLNMATLIGAHAMPFTSAPHLAAWARREGVMFERFDSASSLVRAIKALRVALRERDIARLQEGRFVSIMMDESTSFSKKFIIFYAR